MHHQTEICKYFIQNISYMQKFNPKQLQVTYYILQSLNVKSNIVQMNLNRISLYFPPHHIGVG